MPHVYWLQHRNILDSHGISSFFLKREFWLRILSLLEFSQIPPPPHPIKVSLEFLVAKMGALVWIVRGGPRMCLVENFAKGGKKYVCRFMRDVSLEGLGKNAMLYIM